MPVSFGSNSGVNSKGKLKSVKTPGSFYKTDQKEFDKQLKEQEKKQQEAESKANAQTQKDKEWNLENAAKGAFEFGKEVVGGIQQGGAKVADVALKGGAVLENLFEQDNKKVQENLARTESLRNALKSQKDVTGKTFAGTKDISAQEVMSDPRKAAELAGEALDVATSATQFINPTAAIKAGATGTAKATLGQAAKQIGKEAATFGAVDAIGGGARTYGETGDVGKAIAEGAKTGLTSAISQAGLGVVGEVAGRAIGKARGKTTTPTTGQDGINLTDAQVKDFADELANGKQVVEHKITSKQEAPQEYLGDFRINKNSQKPVLNEEINTKLNDAINDKNLPNDIYDAPVKVATSEDVMNHTELPKTLRTAGQVISERKRIIDEKLNSLYKQTDADRDITALDNDYNKQLERIDKMPDIRAQLEMEKLDADYSTKLNGINDRLANDADEADKFLQVSDAIKQEESNFVNDVNNHIDVGAETYRTINQDRKQAYISELKNQKYEFKPNPKPQETEVILDKVVSSGEDFKDIVDNNTTVAKAAQNTVDEASNTVNFSDNTGYNPGMFMKTFTGAKNWLDKFGSGGQEINRVLTEAVDNRAKAQTAFVNQVKQWRKDAGGKISDNVSKALDGDSTALSKLNNGELKVYEGSRMYLDNAAKTMADGYKNSIQKNLDTISKLDPTKNKAQITKLTNENKEFQSKVDALTSDNKISSYFPHFIKQDASKIDKAVMQLRAGKDLNGNELTIKKKAELQKMLSGVDLQAIESIKKNSAYKIENGFLKKRTGQEGYSLNFEDVMSIYDRALNNELYIKPAFEKVKDVTQQMDLSPEQSTTIAKLLTNIGAKPVDDFGKQINQSLDTIFGNKNITYDKVSNSVRNAIYDSTMGLNFKSALTNLSQNSNTIAKVGNTNYIRGLKQAVSSFKNDSKAYSELVDNNILSSTYNDFLSENKIHNKAHDLLWGMFNGTEQFNRASAYFGGKSKFITDNLKKPEGERLYGDELEKAAQKYGKQIAEKTQFKFDALSTGLNLQSTTVKNLTQFMSYNMKQAEFLKNLVVGDKDSLFVKSGDKWKVTPEGAKAIARYIGANMAYLGTIGAVIGTQPEDMIPFWSDIKGGKIPQSPVMRIITGDEYSPGLLTLAGQGATAISEAGKGNFDKAGESLSDLGSSTGKFLGNTGMLAVPGGAQLQKTVEGAKSLAEGQVTSGSGNIRYLQQPQTDLGNVTDLPSALVLGKNYTSAGREWTANGMETLSKEQTEKINSLPVSDRQTKQKYLDYYMTKKSFPNKSEALDIVRRQAESNPAAAEREIDKYNDELNKASEKYYRKHNTLPTELLKEFDSLKIDKLKYLD